MGLAFGLASYQTVDEADQKIEKLDPQIPESQILPLTAELNK